ncbi:TadA family conjugal transfer-associated ATPase [Catenulispora sp. NF23]|uniref:TadA family conjugal transfer-associated ATPase n=1 Tax=Catenulispora pinistramenti TaxID=2705254 RepID=A0ABS5KJA6_9ACTN|nr:TadA family conjugal transfer-associated ATPase [Catenulispora pinistramenti]MBS2531308.1 TadA family conjugal transfer-associated ATPase [Catenulispora pinistramenti]MBS2545990.1 TadA family conjugal transfer-associated ATPase [Catenulispora pinistramenti]
MSIPPPVKSSPSPMSSGPLPGAERLRLNAALVDRVRTRLATPPVRVDMQAILAALRAEGCMLDGRDLRAAAYQVRSELTGAGVLDRFLSDPEVTDVLVNAPDSVWIERAGTLSRADVRFPDETAVRRLAQRLAAHAGRRLDDAAPCVDGVLPDGARLHAVLPPVAVRGTLISLRVPPRRAFTMERLTAGGLTTEHGAHLLQAIATARLSYLVTGGTGSGKTTLLGALLGLVPADERIVVTEECAEVVVDHPHVARLQCRIANQENRGAVNLRTLVRQALRMRPDRVVVGEVRGPEVLELLAAMNTGHDGCAATLHANGVEDVVARVEALAAPAGLSQGALHAQLASAVQAVVHLVREKGKRRLASIGVIERGFAETQVLPAVDFDAAGTATYGAGAERLSRLLGLEIRETPDDPAPEPENQGPDAGLDHLDSWQEALAAADRLLPVLKNAPGGDEAGPDEPFVADYGPAPARRGGHR